jgi:hypothetical protein
LLLSIKIKHRYKKLKHLLLITFLLSGLFANKQIKINLSEQRAYAIENGKVVFSGRISSGKRGKRTPTGNFTVLQKHKYHKSSKYPKPNGGAKMNYMLRLTHYGIAMHLGYVPNYAASHGCVRMKNGFAQKMFYWADTGIPVKIVGNPIHYSQKKKHYKKKKSKTIYDDPYALNF